MSQGLGDGRHSRAGGGRASSHSRERANHWRAEWEPPMTISFTRRFRRAALLLAAAALFCAATASPGFAYSDEARQKCTGDAFRLCAAEIPNVSKITACMIKRRADLSPGCRAVMDRDLAQKSNAIAAQ